MELFDANGKLVNKPERWSRRVRKRVIAVGAGASALVATVALFLINFSTVMTKSTEIASSAKGHGSGTIAMDSQLEIEYIRLFGALAVPFLVEKGFQPSPEDARLFVPLTGMAIDKHLDWEAEFIEFLKKWPYRDAKLVRPTLRAFNDRQWTDFQEEFQWRELTEKERAGGGAGLSYKGQHPVFLDKERLRSLLGIAVGDVLKGQLFVSCGLAAGGEEDCEAEAALYERAIGRVPHSKAAGKEMRELLSDDGTRSDADVDSMVKTAPSGAWLRQPSTAFTDSISKRIGFLFAVVRNVSATELVDVRWTLAECTDHARGSEPLRSTTASELEACWREGTVNSVIIPKMRPGDGYLWPLVAYRSDGDGMPVAAIGNALRLSNVEFRPIASSQKKRMDVRAPLGVAAARYIIPLGIAGQ